MSTDEEKYQAMMRDGLEMIDEIKKMRAEGRGEPTPAEIAEGDQIKKRAQDILDEIVGKATEHINKGGCTESLCIGGPMMIMLTTMLHNAPDDLLMSMFVAVHRLAVVEVERGKD